MIRIEYNYGEQIGEAYYLHEANNTIKRRMAAFRCKCGNKFTAPISKVKGLEIKGCGCSRGKNPGSRNHTVHGGRHHPLYNVWCAMKSRCYNKNRAQFKDYGGRGVIICDEWKNDFKNFYDWAISNGWKPGLHIDKDSKGDGLLYSPKTCCFITPQRNSNIRRSNHFIEYNGQRKTLSEWASFYLVKYPTLCGRITRGWSLEEAIFGKGKSN